MNSNFFHVYEGLSRTGAFILIASCILVIGGGLTLVFLLLQNTRINSYSETLKNRITSRSVVTIDMVNQKVREVKFSNLEVVTNYNLREYINRFAINDQNRIFNWFRESAFKQFKEDDIDNFIIVNVSFQEKYSKRSNNFKVLLQITSIDTKYQTLVLDSFILDGIKSKIGGSEKNYNLTQNLYDEDRIEKAYGFKNANACFIKVDFSLKPNRTCRINPIRIKYFILNSLFHGLKKTSYFYCYFEKDENEIYVLTDVDAPSQFHLGNNIKRLYAEVNKIFEIKGYGEEYDFALVASKKYDLGKNYKNAKESLTNYSQSIKRRKMYCGVYRNDGSQHDFSDDSNKAIVDGIIQNQALTALFLPIYKLTNEKIMNYGYIVTSRIDKPYSSYVENIFDLKRMAEPYDKSKDLLSLTARKAIPIFSQERRGESQNLCMYVALSELEYVLRIFTHFNDIKTMKIIFIVDNSQVLNLKPTDPAFGIISNIQSNPIFKVFLSINVYDSTCKENVIRSFDGYVIDCKNLDVKPTQDEVLRLQGLCEKYCQYKKPVIGVHLKSWVDVEVAKRLGINTFAAEVISDFSPMIQPIKEKNLKKLKNLMK